MEDDDEFGDLYTDVLRPFASSSSSSAPPPHQASAAPQPLRRPIDLNLQNDEDDAVFGAPSSNPVETLAPAVTADSAAKISVLSVDAAKLDRGTTDDSNSNFGIRRQDENSIEKEVTFDIEEGNLGIEEDVGSEPVIPGLESSFPIRATTDIENLEASRRDGSLGGDGVDGGDDWDSDDSEDDLQIVLNDNNHGHMGMERGRMAGGDDDDDEDEDGLVIVADGDPNQAMEEQDWGEDAAQAADGERKEMGEAGKPGVGGAMASKIGYSNHGFHPFHSQFKYVRPGAAPIPGATTSGPGGVPGQVRPLVNMGPMAGRGRAWGGNASGRGFGSGLEFTLPSHKTIFDVDIDGFEEKPWKYPGVDTSDFFNFGLNEDSWKDYCKQLEQLRLESTMQSKIRVYESGRAEQEYDPDLPPELAAATGIQEVPSENANSIKPEVAQGDIQKGSARVRPPLPTGRAIQVEGGYGERLPSIDTRPPRIRDSDAIIEDSLDDNASEGNNDPNRLDNDNDTPKEDFGGNVAEEDSTVVDSEYADKFPQAYSDQKREPLGPRAPFCDDIPDRDRVLPFPSEPQVRTAGFCAHVSVHPDGELSARYDERQTQGRVCDRSPRMTRSRNSREKKYINNEPEDSVESMDSKQSPLSSPATFRDAHESSVEPRDVDDHDELVPADGSPIMEKDDTISNTIAVSDTLEDGTTKKQKIISQVEQSSNKEPDDGDDSKAARSSDNSRARSGSSRDCPKRWDGIEEEVIQGHSTRMGNVKRHFDEKEQGIHRKIRDGRQDLERNRMVGKGREDYYPYKEFDPSSVHLHMRSDGFERRKERDNPDGAWQRRDDDSHNRRIRTEETRKRERGDEVGSRHRSKVRESDRSDKDELIHSRKQMDNGSHRAHYDKDVVPRYRGRDDNLKGRYEHMDDYHSKRKKDEEHLRRDHANKEEMMHGQRENTNRRKRERDEVLDQRKRDGQQRLRDGLDDHHSVRHKDESWLQRERSERQREREEWQRLKQPHEDNKPKRERDEGRSVTRGGRSSEDKGWVGHPKIMDESKGPDKEYQYKETIRHGEPSKRRDRTEDESSRHGGREDAYARGNQVSNGERRSRLERPSVRNDRSVNASDDLKVQDKKHKENAKRNRESEGGDYITLASSKRNQEDHGGQSNETVLKGSIEKGFGERDNPAQHQSSRKQKEEASSDDEQQDLRRGRSKLERWTSHKERDFSIKSKSSSTQKCKEMDGNNSGSLEGRKISDEPSKPVETVDIQHSLAEEKDCTDLEAKDGDTRLLDDRHLDTVEKLKKRSERFKLPMPSDKDALAVKKLESEALPSAKSGSLADSEIKQERPARKRRWISN
ncbi:hypothetical protein L484_005444 [Morus notabilis]|uniref:Pre-mRNA polyadenylation factor Fip1 domain-containing protein n=1 Tax=Morus notabilis TaxID=981085 RepID=W9RMM9_9ROSA|nr:hypothetical protein L484_005444 [Morus notabilis]